MIDLSSPFFWTALVQIIGIDIVLGGDNAIMIALASRALPPKQQRQAIFYGCLGAIVLRFLFAGIAAQLLVLPYIKLAAGITLVWIGIKLLQPEDDHNAEIPASDRLWKAVRVILFADIAMSVDNVIGITAVAQGNMTLVALGILISVPLIIYGSKIVVFLMKRVPLIIVLGAMLLGYIGGDILRTEPVLARWVDLSDMQWKVLFPFLGALIVLLVGKFWSYRKNDSSMGEKRV